MVIYCQLAGWDFFFFSKVNSIQGLKATQTWELLNEGRDINIREGSSKWKLQGYGG